jgi:predicted nucleic acid-binding Zn ribbon protein
MALEPVNTVLGKFRKAQWKQQREFGKLQHAWSEVVGPTVAAQTQPTQITAQQVLLVATSSAVWAQNLAFERQRLLIKLNDLLNQPLTDIRFSTSQWRSRRSSSQSAKSWTPDSLVTRPGTVADPQAIPDCKAVFLRWSERVKARSQSYPLCSPPSRRAVSKLVSTVFPVQPVEGAVPVLGSVYLGKPAIAPSHPALSHLKWPIYTVVNLREDIIHCLHLLQPARIDLARLQVIVELMKSR